ncbi:MAG: DUF6600 domain-containing protein, partial [Candidatus Korobacteraceae bacterium]
MRFQRQFGWLLASLLVVGMSAGSVLAQDQGQDNAPVMQYPESAGNVPAQYPDSGNNAPPQQYPSAQQYPNGGSAGAPQYPNQGNGPGQIPPQDPSGRVARLQYSSGEVSMQPGGVNDWVAASLNRPLTTADRVWTDKNSRAELNVGDGFIRMSSETSVTLTNVSDSTVQVELDQGVLEVTVKHLEKGEIYEIDTPNFAFTVMKTGVYRFDVHPNDDQSWVTVSSGSGEATGKGPAVKVKSGEQVRFSNGESLQHVAYSAPVPDGFDDWAQVRDKRLDSSLSARYVSPGVIGYQDLDANGSWQNAAPYGPVWTPNSVPAGWAPYRYGHWVWIAPWGWTWVDDAPWGFAPFHYGRWVYWNNAWAWAPGPLGYWNPYYAPALVGWIGGAGFGVGFGWGWGGFGIGIGFGWFPLGWGAPYYPHYCGWGYGGWYHGGGWVSSGYLHNVNVTNTHINNVNNITNNYYHNNFAGVAGNRTVPNAVTAAPKSAFTSGAAINKVGTVVPKSGVNSGQLMHTADVNPTRQSVLGNSPTRTAPPAAAAGRSVVTHATPPTGPARFGGTQPANAHGNAGSATQANVNGAHGTNAVQGTNAAHAPNAGSSVNTAHTPNAGAGANAASATHNVPRPPSAGGTVNGQATNQQVARSNVPSNPAAHNVPRPPANYSYHAPSGTPQQSAPSHQSTPSQHATPQGNSHGSGGSNGSSHGNGNSSGASRAYGSARPPANYSYHAAPAYSGSSSYAAGRSGVSPYSASRGYSASPNYGSSRSYGSSP